MQFEGNYVYLSITEQRLGFSSPINLENFDAHAERVAADTELDKLVELQQLDEYELTHQQRHNFPRELVRAHERSDIIRTIAIELASRALMSGG